MITDLANYDLEIESGLHYETPENMAFYDKSDLKYEYNWSVYDENDPKIDGNADGSPLNIEEGHEVLYFINAFAEKHQYVNKITGIIIERLLKDHLPAEIRSQKSVREWLENNG